MHVRIWAKVKLDATGNKSYLPVILLQTNGELTVLEPLLRYFVTFKNSYSHSWMTKLCEIVGKLLDYIQANYGVHEKPVQLFEGFVDALYNGTFDENGYDPTNLCWIPSNAKTINPKLKQLNQFSDWMANNKYVSESVNPWTSATSVEKRFNWIAWYRRNQHSFLGHLGKSTGKALLADYARAVKLRSKSKGNAGPVKAFPEDFETALLRHGFVRPGRQNEIDILKKFDWRGICITILLLYGARRLSEPFHLWIGDVVNNPTRPGRALVRIYHPLEGAAPTNPKINGRPAANRQAYLQTFYPEYIPRTLGTGNYHAGFKGTAFADDDEKYIQVHWLPSYMGEAFMWAYHNYMQQRAQLGINGKKNPFAFVSHHVKYKGEPYTIKSFERAWARAIRRIGLPLAKKCGTSTHGGRHSSGRRANKSGVSEYDAQEMFAHSSPESQRVYRTPSPEEVTDSLDIATRRIQYDTNMKIAGLSPQAAPSDFRKIWIE